MADNDITIVKQGDARVMRFGVAAGAVGSIGPGEPVKKSTNDVVLCATGDPEIGTDEFVGIAMETSTETATVDGYVNVMIPTPGKTVMRCACTTVANMDTQAELDGLLMDCVTFDLTSTTFTVDENEADDPNQQGLQIVGGNITNGTLDFVVQQNVGFSGGTIGQTID